MELILNDHKTQKQKLNNELLDLQSDKEKLNETISSLQSQLEVSLFDSHLVYIIIRASFY